MNMNIAEIELLNKRIEDAMILKYFDNGVTLKQIYAEAKEVFDKYVGSIANESKISKNKIFVPAEIIQWANWIDK